MSDEYGLSLAYLNEMQEAELNQRLVHKCAAELVLIFQVFKQIHPKLHCLSAKDGPPRLDALIVVTCAINVRMLLSTQKYLHLFHVDVLRTHVGPDFSRTTSTSLNGSSEISSTDAWIIVCVICLKPNYMTRKPIDTTMNCNAKPFDFVVAVHVPHRIRTVRVLCTTSQSSTFSDCHTFWI